MTAIDATEPWRPEWGKPLTSKPWPQYVTADGWEAIGRASVPAGVIPSLTSTAEAVREGDTVLVTVYVDIDGKERYAVRFGCAP